MEKMGLFSVPSSIEISRLTILGPSKQTVSSIDKEEPQAKLDPYSLQYLYSALFATILEDIILEFKILEECNNTLRIMKVHADINKLLGKKFNIDNRPIVDELEMIDRKNLEKEEYKIHKIENDRTLIKNFIVNTYRDLCLNGSYKFLSETVTTILGCDKYRLDLATNESRNRSTRRELAKQLRQQRNHIRTVNYDTDVAIDHLRSAIEDATLKAETRSRFVSKWQIARIEQQGQTIKNTECLTADKVEYYKQQIDDEQRIHQEIELLVNIVTNECLAKVEEWMSKYDTDMEAADLKVQIMKNRYQNQLDERVELENTYAKRKELMEDWIMFKDERAKANAYRAKMLQSAITVQAWWRGLLVRRELGPYRVSKKKGVGRKKK